MLTYITHLALSCFFYKAASRECWAELILWGPFKSGISLLIFDGLFLTGHFVKLFCQYSFQQIYVPGFILALENMYFFLCYLSIISSLWSVHQKYVMHFCPINVFKWNFVYTESIVKSLFKMNSFIFQTFASFCSTSA